MDAQPNNTTLLRGESPANGGWTSTRWTPQRWVYASFALHVSVLGILLYTRPPRLAAIDMPGDRSGHRILLTYNPGRSVPSSAIKAIKPLPNISSLSHTIAAPTPAPAVPASTIASASTDTVTGADGQGDGNLTIALELAHPYPHPDLSQLPSGTRGDVIVDIVIDSTGRIAKYTVTRGLGHGVDETVLATIQQWTFQPATRNGVPVASEQELLFHYERG
jgi:periplasmic protein TonB